MSATFQSSLSGVRVAVLAGDGVEQIELTSPVEALRKAGATIRVISPDGEAIQGYHHDEPANLIPADAALSSVAPDQFDALVLPGGVANPDRLRTQPAAVAFVRGFAESDKPIGAICHGPWTLIETGFVRGRTMTSWPSLKTDLANAGAHWVDQEVVVDGTLVTSRNPDDLPAFNQQILSVFGRKAA